MLLVFLGVCGGCGCFVKSWGLGLLVLAFVLLNLWVGLGYLAGCEVVGR